MRLGITTTPGWNLWRRDMAAVTALLPLLSVAVGAPPPPAAVPAESASAQPSLPSERQPARPVVPAQRPLSRRPGAAAARAFTDTREFESPRANRRPGHR